MHLPKYAALANIEHETYEFLSSGPKGTIKKMVNYTEIDTNVYSLGFGDWDETAQEVRDNLRSNNADRDKVLATVATTVIDFIRHHPKATVIVEGETAAKTRLYQMGINSNWQEISQLFEVEGFSDGVWEHFNQKKNYRAFVLRAK